VCQEFAAPSFAMYWHMGETAIRFASLSAPNWPSENRALIRYLLSVSGHDAAARSGNYITNTHVHISLDIRSTYVHSAVRGRCSRCLSGSRPQVEVAYTNCRPIFGGLAQEIPMSTQVVLLTGGLTGIGRAAAVAFAKKGARVVVAGRHDEAGKALVNELHSFGAEAEFINADVRKDEDVRALVDKTVARFGRLDVAVNNAGTEGQVGPITDQTAESYAATFDTNVLGVILSMKHEVRAMQGQGSGAIINISSTYGHEGAAGASVYVGSKHAVEGITKSVALETVKSGIRVNAVAPGPIDTGMLTRFTRTPENKAALVTTVPMDRLGLSEEVANAIVFIASDEASFITGHVLNVDGGKSH